MSVLLVIPARGGSKGIPHKNLQPVGGRPLISYAVKNALAATTVDHVIVSTEDVEIAEVAQTWGADVPFMRAAELAQDHVSLIPVLAHAAQATDALSWNVTVVVSLQPTAPLLRPQTIDAGLCVLRDTGCDSVVSVRKVDHNHPYRIQQLDITGHLIPLFPEGEQYLQKQDLPVFYAFSGGLYVRRRQLLEKWSGSGFCLGIDRRGIEVKGEESINIDSLLDLALVRTVVEGHFKT
ncbi:acylneuraminate cytidylyltransferase family protein [Acidobacteria bacterium AH-259-A15]|nr:acylneuraminate cytidylyltransferase family protein [Acidobacteria bacterium AH-259-A15]